MIVQMRVGSGQQEIDAVCRRARADGLDPEVFSDDGHTVIDLSGEAPPDLKAALQALPGVEAVIRRATPAPITRDLRIESIRPLLPPAILLEELPLLPAGAVIVSRTREAVTRILRGQDDRLIVIVGPCSIHDVDAAREYAIRLRALADEVKDDLFLIMRVYFEKPRTTVGWKGLINDPYLDGSFGINDGLHLARQLLLEVVGLGLPVGCEFLDPILPQFFADVVTWGAIGARTTESQVHRELASGLSMPVGFKNGTGGGIQMAIDALHAANYQHRFIGATEQGLAAIVATRGNPDCHVILRGGRSGLNYDPESVQRTLGNLHDAGLAARLMIDTSHGNSEKDYRRQPHAAQVIGEQIAQGERGIIGVMMESFLVDGRQNLVDRADLVYGQSITDACMGWDMTVPVLHDLAAAVRARRTALAAGAPIPAEVAG